MIKNPVIYFVLMIFITHSVPALAQSAFENENIYYKYDPYRELWFDYHVSEANDSFHIFFGMDFLREVNPDKDFHIYYELLDSYKAKPSGNIFTLNMAKNCIYHEYSSYIYSSVVAEPDDKALLVFHISGNGGYHYSFDIPLRSEYIFDYSGLTLFSAVSGTPVIRSFVHSGDSLYVGSLNPAVQKAYVFRYSHDFEAADPPMALLDRNVGKNLSYDSMFVVSTGNIFVLHDEGLYFIQSDTATSKGLTVRCEEEHYPKLALMDDIFEPIIYMSTYDEIEKLKHSVDKRKAFEAFWLNIARSQEKARRIIRVFYQRVEEADNFFTTYKEGWKTDMGMIYIFFGPPDAVYNDGESEKWYYAKNGNLPAVNFTFLKLKNIFSPVHYFLDRQEGYRSIWYKKIDTWRKGEM